MTNTSLEAIKPHSQTKSRHQNELRPPRLTPNKPAPHTGRPLARSPLGETTAHDMAFPAGPLPYRSGPHPAAVQPTAASRQKQMHGTPKAKPCGELRMHGPRLEGERAGRDGSCRPGAREAGLARGADQHRQWEALTGQDMLPARSPPVVVHRQAPARPGADEFSVIRSSSRDGQTLAAYALWHKAFLAMSNPGLMVGRDVGSLAQAAAQDTDACSALQDLSEPWSSGSPST